MSGMLVLALRVLAWGIAAAWVWKAVEAAWGMPRVANLMRPEFDVAPRGEPRVVVVVPARDEGASVRGCLTSLLAQDYANLRIVAVDDRSGDETGQIMDELAGMFSERMRVLHIKELPEGWLGKTHALAAGAREAIVMYEAEYLLFTDADVFFAPQVIAAVAGAGGGDGGRPLCDVADFDPALGGGGYSAGFYAGDGGVGGAGMEGRRCEGAGCDWDWAFNLMRTAAYQELGGFEALRMQIVEDVTLARRVKKRGMRQRIAFAPGMVTLHWASGAMGVVNGMTKNLFAVFGFRPAMLLGALLWVTVFWLGPLAELGFEATAGGGGYYAWGDCGDVCRGTARGRRAGMDGGGVSGECGAVFVLDAAVDGGDAADRWSVMAGDILSAGGAAAECGEAAVTAANNGGSRGKGRIARERRGCSGERRGAPRGRGLASRCGPAEEEVEQEDAGDLVASVSGDDGGQEVDEDEDRERDHSGGLLGLLRILRAGSRKVPCGWMGEDKRAYPGPISAAK